MSSVWIVTEGDYSDYHIVAVFETEQQARNFMNGADTAETRYGTSTGVGVDEWKLGEPDAGVYQPTYQVSIDMESGNLLDGTYTKEFTAIELHPRDWSGYAVAGQSIEYCYPAHVTGMSVVSRDHALKIAAEGRQAYLREKRQA